MVSSFLVVNHYCLINFNYVVSAVLQTQLFQGRLLATWNYTLIVRMQYYTKILKFFFFFFFLWLPCYRHRIGVARTISRQASYLDKQGERAELWRKQSVNHIACKFLAYFNFRKTINTN